MGILLLGLLWQFDPTKNPLPIWPICMFHAVTGLDCPGCGATRATHELLHGRWAAAWHDNALWVLLLPIFGYCAVSEWRVLNNQPPLPGNLSHNKWFGYAIAFLAIGFFALRNLP